MECRGKAECIEITVAPHGGMRGRCSECGRAAPGYDRLPERCWWFVPLWGIRTRFHYAPRRVQCEEHGVIVEQIPWSEGKRPLTTAKNGVFGTLGVAAELARDGRASLVTFSST